METVRRSGLGLRRVGTRLRGDTSPTASCSSVGPVPSIVQVKLVPAVATSRVKGACLLMPAGLFAPSVSLTVHGAAF